MAALAGGHAVSRKETLMKKRNHACAFTLIELLVVIAVIAVLMGILMPALGKARKQAQGTACQSHLKQIGLAANLFAEDHGNKIPQADDKKLLPGNNHLETTRWFKCFTNYLEKRPEGGDYRKVKMYRCPSYPEKRSMINYIVNGYSKTQNVQFVGLTNLLSIKRVAEHTKLTTRSIHGKMKKFGLRKEDYKSL